MLPCASGLGLVTTSTWRPECFQNALVMETHLRLRLPYRSVTDVLAALVAADGEAVVRTRVVLELRSGLRQLRGSCRADVSSLDSERPAWSTLGPSGGFTLHLFPKQAAGVHSCSRPDASTHLYGASQPGPLSLLQGLVQAFPLGVRHEGVRIRALQVTKRHQRWTLPTSHSSFVAG